MYKDVCMNYYQWLWSWLCSLRVTFLWFGGLVSVLQFFNVRELWSLLIIELLFIFYKEIVNVLDQLGL